MPLRIQRLALDLIQRVLGGAIDSATPEWLVSPGELECRSRWPLFCEIYHDLTKRDLPERAPLRESRRVDGVWRAPDSAPRIIEIDESQHFNLYRGMTLDRYSPDIQIAFDRRQWIAHCRLKKRIEGVGFGSLRPPLFPQKTGPSLKGFSRCTLRYPPSGIWLPAHSAYRLLRN